MKIFAALDVSDKTTYVCVVDGDGAIVWRGVCATDPAVLAATLARHAPGLERVLLALLARDPAIVTRTRGLANLPRRSRGEGR